MYLYDFLLGADIGKVNDPSSFVLLKRLFSKENIDTPLFYDIVFIHEVELGTPYPGVIEDLETIVSHKEISGRVNLVADRTGVGVAVVDFVRESKILQDITWSISISSGQKDRRDADSPMDFYVPKRELVGATQVAIQKKKLRAKPGVEKFAKLKNQLLEFQIKRTDRGNSVYEGQGVQHDDLVIALLCPLWLSQEIPLTESQGEAVAAPETLLDGLSAISRGIPSWRDRLPVQDGVPGATAADNGMLGWKVVNSQKKENLV